MRQRYNYTRINHVIKDVCRMGWSSNQGAHNREQTQKFKVIYPNQKITFSVNELSHVLFY